MKNIYKIILILITPVKLFAQDTTVVKEQANVLAKAFVKGDYKTLVDHMYPRLVTTMGGKEKMLTQASSGMSQLKAQGIQFKSVTVGSPGKFFKAGKEIHCLVPEIITMKLPSGSITASSYLLAISADGGKKWSFIDLNKGTIPQIPKLFPYFNPALKIPEPHTPVMGQ